MINCLPVGQFGRNYNLYRLRLREIAKLIWAGPNKKLLKKPAGRFFAEARMCSFICEKGVK
jgi:hypothetical protein